jgi:hypothetical protein
MSVVRRNQVVRRRVSRETRENTMRRPGHPYDHALVTTYDRQWGVTDLATRATTAVDTRTGRRLGRTESWREVISAPEVRSWIW